MSAALYPISKQFYFFSVNITDDGKKALLTLAKGDMRKVLNVLQSTSMAFDVVNEDNVYMCVGYPLRSEIENVLQTLLSAPTFDSAFDSKLAIYKKYFFFLTLVQSL